MKLDDSLSVIFNLPSTEYTSEVPVIIPEAEPIDKFKRIDTDFDLARDNMTELLLTGNEALLDMLEVAKQSEDPKAYQVVAVLLKQMADMNFQLMQLHHSKQRLESPKPKELPVGNITTNQSIFVGSTAELSTFLNKL